MLHPMQFHRFLSEIDLDHRGRGQPGDIAFAVTVRGRCRVAWEGAGGAFARTKLLPQPAARGDAQAATDVTNLLAPP